MLRSTSGDLSMSRADIPDGWGLRCMVYLVYLDQDGNIVLDESNQEGQDEGTFGDVYRRCLP